jgi:hypothetical protein
MILFCDKNRYKILVIDVDWSVSLQVFDHGVNFTSTGRSHKQVWIAAGLMILATQRRTTDGLSIAFVAWPSSINYNIQMTATLLAKVKSDRMRFRADLEF